MLVDDVKMNNIYLEKIIKKFKLKIKINIYFAYDGDECIDIFIKYNKNKSLENIQLIFMDYNMARVNGSEATKKVFYLCRLNN